MKKSEVQLGKVYNVKVSGKVQPVRLDSVSRHGGWDGTNVDTGRKIRIHTAGKLRSEVKSRRPATHPEVTKTLHGPQTPPKSSPGAVVAELARAEAANTANAETTPARTKGRGTKAAPRNSLEKRAKAALGRGDIDEAFDLAIKAADQEGARPATAQELKTAAATAARQHVDEAIALARLADSPLVEQLGAQLAELPAPAPVAPAAETTAPAPRGAVEQVGALWIVERKDGHAVSPGLGANLLTRGMSRDDARAWALAHQPSDVPAVQTPVALAAIEAMPPATRAVLDTVAGLIVPAGWGVAHVATASTGDVYAVLSKGRRTQIARYAGGRGEPEILAGEKHTSDKVAIARADKLAREAV